MYSEIRYSGWIFFGLGAKDINTPANAVEIIDSTSAATEIEKIFLPDVTHTNSSEAVKALNSKGIKVNIVYDFSDVVEEDYVISQDMPANSYVEKDSVILLTVSKGPDGSKASQDIACPYEYEQKIEIVSSGSIATLTLYEWDNAWVSRFSTTAYIGKNGVSENNYEGSGMTPKGTFKIGFAYGLYETTSKIKFVRVTENSVWVDDPLSSYYNVLTSVNNVGSAHYENTYKQFTDGRFSTNIYFENNGDGLTPGTATSNKGSVITICGYNYDLAPTAGCIDIKSEDMTVLLSYLDSAKNPVVIIQ